MFSRIFRLNWKDLVKGLTVAALAALFAALIQHTDLIPWVQNNPIAQAVVASVLAYLSKNLATDENGKLGGKL